MADVLDFGGRSHDGDADQTSRNEVGTDLTPVDTISDGVGCSRTAWSGQYRLRVNPVGLTMFPSLLLIPDS
jgi:hypothetical protein